MAFAEVAFGMVGEMENGNGNKRHQWFNPQFNIGTIITLLVILGGGLLTLQRIQSSQTYLEDRLNEIKVTLHDTSGAVQSTQNYIAGATEHTRMVDTRLDQLEKSTQALSDRLDAQTNMLLRMQNDGLHK